MILKSIKKLFNKKENPALSEIEKLKKTVEEQEKTINRIYKRSNFDSLDFDPISINDEEKYEALMGKIFDKSMHPSLRRKMTGAIDSAKEKGFAMDGMQTFAQDDQVSFKNAIYSNGIYSNSNLFYFAQSTFPGFTTLGMLSQHWLIAKACIVPAKDAVRKGYDIEAKGADDKIKKEILKLDKKFRLKYNMINLVQFANVFGIRIAMFKVASTDPDYYYKPFNIDGVLPGTYEGISQIDPYWVSPQLDSKSVSDPTAINFYEPEWWNISGKLVHHTHLVIYRPEEVADFLKPSYMYAGISKVQKILISAYAAERTADEGPILVASKRMTVMKLDTAQALADKPSFLKRMQFWVDWMTNKGVKIIGDGEEIQQFDTNLQGIEEVTMLQYQRAAASVGMPATKLLETSPKGWSGEGEYEDSNYRQLIESIQEEALEPLAKMHHQLVIKSIIEPKYGVTFDCNIIFNPLDALTDKEQAEVNKINADTDSVLVMAGAIDGQDVRDRLRNNPDSSYTSLDKEAPEPEENMIELGLGKEEEIEKDESETEN